MNYSDYITVMIVDDDNLAVEDLKNLIPWEQHGFKVVVTAYDGKEALEAYDQYHPQIVLIDIRMPIMDGLEFCQRVLTAGRQIKILLLTAYKDFDYARQAIKLGASSYLLKHEINKDSLLREIQKVGAEIRKEGTNRNIVRRKFIKDILSGKNPENDESNEIDSDSIKSVMNFILLILKVDLPYPVIHVDTENEAFPTFSGIENECLKLTGNLEYLESIDMDSGKCAILLSSGNFNSYREIKERVCHISLSLLKFMKNRTGKTFSIAVAYTRKGFSALPLLYQNALEVFMFSPFYGREKVIFTQETTRKAFPLDQTMKSGIEELVNAFNKGNQKQLEEMLVSLFNRTASPEMRLDDFKKLCDELMQIIDNYRRKSGLDSIRNIYKQGGIDRNLWYSVQDISQWFLSEFRKMLESESGVNSPNYSKKVQQAIHYITSHYTNELSVEDVANELGISKIYLFQLFHKETGQTILDFITKLRIGKAKSWLEDSDYKIYEIAEKTGYKSSQYFSKIFFKYTNMTPLEYRERKGIHESTRY